MNDKIEKINNTCCPEVLDGDDDRFLFSCTEDAIQQFASEIVEEFINVCDEEDCEDCLAMQESAARIIAKQIKKMVMEMNFESKNRKV